MIDVLWVGEAISDGTIWNHRRANCPGPLVAPPFLLSPTGRQVSFLVPGSDSGLLIAGFLAGMIDHPGQRGGELATHAIVHMLLLLLSRACLQSLGHFLVSFGHIWVRVAGAAIVRVRFVDNRFLAALDGGREVDLVADGQANHGAWCLAFAWCRLGHVVVGLFDHGKEDGIAWGRVELAYRTQGYQAIV